MSNCSHTKEESVYIEENDLNPYTGEYEEHAHWVNENIYTYEDINIYEYRCTQCGKIFKYN